MIMTILAVGDVCGEPGLSFLDKNLKSYRRENGIDFVVVNILLPVKSTNRI